MAKTQDHFVKPKRTALVRLEQRVFCGSCGSMMRPNTNERFECTTTNCKNSGAEFKMPNRYIELEEA